MKLLNVFIALLFFSSLSTFAQNEMKEKENKLNP